MSLKIDASLLVANPADAGPLAEELQAAGYNGVYTFEGQHDPFLPLAMASAQAKEIELITGIAVAFGRSPLTVAHLGYDLHMMSGGRFIMGMGSQVKAHIERRYSMPWSKPAARMREFVQAVHAIWDSWETNERLNFDGEFYQHTLMMPTFSPGPNPAGRPPIYLAGIGKLMTQVAGEVGDGYMVHPFHTPQFLNAFSLPNLQLGIAKAGVDKQVAVSAQVIMATGFSDQEIEAATAAARNQIAFYASTPAYLPVLENAGYEGISAELHALSKQGDWAAMAGLIDDKLLNAIAVIGTPKDVASQILQSRGDVVQRVSPIAYGTDTKLFAEVIKEIRSAEQSFKK
ncbi:hypothetical protein SIN8267_01821 [Sinobacterium norvegicum]|uniref:Luciferase-like domain-containing protein n=1 Tax=Sinobacterium norvegicum TaxID=1641715 RepID=A0ABN8EJY8_9GAMM|nr:TIGR03617 family F420-dependent LLM class oxidoreductase [Sinobacterium norvegicum]CAH0991707.1 hypothetical protein SIN8267_01821 [Sinobacterium norvegicum]